MGGGPSRPKCDLQDPENLTMGGGPSRPKCDLQDPELLDCYRAGLRDSSNIPADCENVFSGCQQCVSDAQTQETEDKQMNALYNCFLTDKDQNVFDKLQCIQGASKESTDLKKANAGMNCLINDDNNQDILYLMRTGEKP